MNTHIICFCEEKKKNISAFQLIKALYLELCIAADSMTPDWVLFFTKNCLYFSYFSEKAYVVSTH